MAAGTKLQLQFETMGGLKTWSFSRANPGVTKANVQALVQSMIANGTIFENQPIRIREAKTVTTSENVYDLS